MARGRSGDATMLVKGPLVTDEFGLPIKVVTTAYDESVDCDALTPKTHFVALEAVDSNIRYKVRPKKFRHISAPATDDDTPIAAGATVIEAVYPGCVIAFRQTSPVGDVSGIPFQASYVPVLAL